MKFKVIKEELEGKKNNEIRTENTFHIINHLHTHILERIGMKILIMTTNISLYIIIFYLSYHCDDSFKDTCHIDLHTCCNLSSSYRYNYCDPATIQSAYMSRVYIC